MKYLFDGRSGLLSFDTSEVFEEEHTKDLVMININKGTHLFVCVQFGFQNVYYNQIIFFPT